MSEQNKYPHLFPLCRQALEKRNLCITNIHTFLIETLSSYLTKTFRNTWLLVKRQQQYISPSFRFRVVLAVGVFGRNGYSYVTRRTLFEQISQRILETDDIVCLRSCFRRLKRARSLRGEGKFSGLEMEDPTRVEDR